MKPFAERYPALRQYLDADNELQVVLNCPQELFEEQFVSKHVVRAVLRDELDPLLVIAMEKRLGL